MVLAGFLLQHDPKYAHATTTACSSGAAAQNNYSVAPSHGQAFYIDTGANPKLDAGYIGYRITNSTGSTQSDLWGEVSDFSGGVLNLSNSLDHYQRITTLTNSSTAPAYFLLKATGATSTPQSHHLKVWVGRPDLPTSTLKYECIYTFSSVKETIKAAANKVQDTGLGTAAAIEVSNTSPQVGQTITITVEGTTGTIGAGAAPDGSIVWLTPAAVSSWPTRSLRLEGVSAIFERNSANGQKWTASGDQVTYTDQLIITNAQACLRKNASNCTGGNGSTSPEYRATFTFRVVGIPTATVKAVPVAQIASGTQIKHADTTAVGSTIDITFGSVAINASLTKSVTSTTGLTAVTCGGSCVVPGGINGTTYVAVPYRLTATSTNATAIVIDEIVDQPQTGTIYKTGSAKITDIGRTNSTINDPSQLVSEAALNPRPVHYVGPFNFSSATNASLDYQMWVPNGSYTNTAYAKLGDLVIGASTSAMSKVIVTSDGSGTVGVVTTTETLGVIATTDPATSITTTGATMNGTVDPNGATPLTGQFEYSLSPTLSGATTVTATTPSSGTLSGLSDPTTVSYSLSGLSSNTTYYYRVKAGAGLGTILSFTTNAVVAPPTVTTVSATSITSGGATLNGTINPNLTSVLTIEFIYGTSATLASGNTTVILDDGAGANLTASGASAQPFSTAITGLANGTTYYFKLRGCTVANCSSFIDGSILNFVAVNPPSNPVLAVTKTEDDADNSVSPGQLITYTVTIANSGGVTGTTSFTDTIPAGMGTPADVVGSNCGSPGSSYSVPTLTVSNLTVTNANNCIVTYTVTVNNPLNEGTALTNSVDVAASAEGGNNPAAVPASTLTVDATPNLSTSTKTVSDNNGGNVLGGDTLTYTLTIINTGDGRATGVAATDTIDTDTQNVTNVQTANCGSPSNSSTATALNVTSITVNVSTNCVITFDVTVKNGLTNNTSLANTATIGAATEGGLGASLSSTTLFTTAIPALAVTHSENDADNAVTPSQVVTYTVNIQNTSTGAASGISASSSVDSDATLDTSSFNFTNCGSPGNTSSSSSLALSSISVAGSTTCVVTYQITVNNNAANGATIPSAVDVSAATEGGNDPAAANATTLTVSVTSTPGVPAGTHFMDGATNLNCNGVTKNRAVRVTWSSVAGAVDYEVSLDGGAATSTSGNSFYDWTMPAVDGTHTFAVRSVDNLNAKSAYSSDCSVTLDETAPSVDAGTNKTTNAGFTQSSSSASDSGSGIAAYAWTKLSGPGTITFNDSSILHPDISADTDGTYVLKLTITDNAGNSANDTFTLTWDGTGPTVDAGTDKTTKTGFTQSSSSASDGGSGIATYVWTKQSGTGTITFNDSTILHPDISADTSGTFVLKLTVTDSAGNSANDTFTLIWDTAVPSVDAGTNKTTNAGFVQNSSSASDSGSGIATYAWSKQSGPGTITFDDTTILHPDISADTDGTYVLRLTVTDEAGNNSSDTFTLIWDTGAPSVDAGTDKTANSGFTQSSSSASDGGSGIATYAWTKVSGPGSISFNDTTILHPDISADTDGVYVLRLTVTDNAGNSANDSFILTWDTGVPTVDAGTDKTANSGFTQSSSSASDGGSGIATYAWIKVSGPGTVSFDDNSLLHPSISADSNGTYVIRLTVTDNNSNTSSDTFTLLWDTAAPSVDAGTDKSKKAMFTQDATSSDGGSGIATYAWTKVSGPGAVTFTNSTDEDPQVSVDTDGSYVLKLTVTDNAGNSANDTFGLFWDATPPVPSIDTNPPSLTNNVTSGFTFSATDNFTPTPQITYNCKLDSGSFVLCTSPDSFPVTEGSRTFTVKAIDQLGNEATISYSWTVDVTPPVITMLGSSPANLTVGDVYNDAGATANDNHDGSVTVHIVTHNNVDTNLAGSYTVTYDVTDAAGNVAPTVSRNVIVNDNDGATFTVEESAPNSGDANIDGTPDSNQKDVTSFVNPVTNTYAVLENLDSCQNTNVSVTRENALSQADGDYQYPAGLIQFTLVCGTPGQTVTVSQVYFGISASHLIARKYNPLNHTYSTIGGAVITDVVIGGLPAVQITYQITDGGPLDQDGLANGTIIDPSGPAVLAASAGSTSNGVTAPNTGLAHQSDVPYTFAMAFGVCFAAFGIYRVKSTGRTTIRK